MGQTFQLFALSVGLVGAMILGAGCGSANGGRPEDVTKVISELTSSDLRIRQSAVESLLSLASSPQHDSAIREKLTDLARIVANKNEDPEVRGQVVRAIAIVSERKRVDQSIVPGLIKILLDEGDKEIVRNWIAMSVPDLAPPEVAGPPLLAASRSENRTVRVNAAQQLSRVRFDPERAIVWMRQSVSDPSPAMRVAVVRTAAEYSRRDRRALEVFLLGLADRDEMVRREAVGLAVHGNILGTESKDARAAMMKLLQDPSPQIVMSAAAALMQMSPGDEARYLAILIKGLQSDKPEAREAAARVLSLSGPGASAAVPDLKNAEKDRSDSVRVHAAMALIRITGEKEPYATTIMQLERSPDAQAAIWAKLYRGMIAAAAEQREEKKDRQKK
jgi:HEAT repeat protein